MVSESPNITSKALLAGSMSGVCQISLTYPIKFIKTQMQLEEKFGMEKKYKGMIDCAMQTVRSHGVFGLYRGLNLFFYATRSAVSFSTFEKLKTKFVKDDGTLNPQNRFFCGLCAGAFEAALVLTPLETIECKLIHERRLGKSRFKGFINCAMVTVTEEGIKSLYTGLFPSVLKNAGNQGTRFFIVETLKNWHKKDDPNKSVPKPMVGFFGMVAGFCSVFITNPVDVVKTRMQGLNYSQYKNMFDCFMKIQRQEGFYGFYRGLSPRLSRVGLEVSFTFMFYDMFMDLLKSGYNNIS